MEILPTLLWTVSTFLSSAFILPSWFLNTASSLSRRATGNAVGIGSTCTRHEAINEYISVQGT